MAQIKVERRSLRPEEYINLRYAALKNRIFEDAREITPVRIRNARQTGDTDFDFYDDWHELKKGELCYTPDGSVFFEADADVSGFADKPVCLYWKTSSEVIVKVNGRYAGGIDPNRRTVRLGDLPADGKLHFEMYGFNRSKPDDERNPDTASTRGCRQEFGGLYLVHLNDAVQSLCYDLELFTDIIGSDVFPEDYRALVTREVDRALELIDFDDVRTDDVQNASAYLEKNLYANTTYKGSGRVALVGHSHLDLAYYWRRVHTVQKNLRTVLIQLRLMDRYPEFRYCHTQPYVFETLEKNYPEVFAELREKIAAGQFEPVGAMYVEPDCNIPSAESLVRQCLYGQRYYRAAFGKTVDTCWLPDVFGNSWILPQILKKSGVDYFVSNKMSTWNDTNRFPHNNFIWRGIDGTEVWACVPPTHFISWNEPSQVAANWQAFQEKNTGAETLQMFGYGDGGSGATEEMLELARRFRKLSVMPETRQVSASEFLKENFTPDRELVVWDGELYLEMHRGVTTTKAELKRYNRLLENKFRTAELLAVLRMANGTPYPAEELRRLWKRFLVNQFHDILPGSHITPVYRDAIDDLTAVEAGLDALIGVGETLWNPLDTARGGVEFLPGDGRFTRCGVQGRFARVDFSPLGGGTIDAASDDASWFAFDGETVTTPLLTARLAPDGSFTSLVGGGREFAKPGFNALHLYDDRPGNYDAWDILPDYADRERDLTLAEPLHTVAVDGACAELACVLTTKRSRIERRLRFFRQEGTVEVEHLVDWHESHKLLKALFPANVLARDLVCDTSAGFIKRPLTANTSWERAKFEFCTHKWFEVSESDAGVAVLNHSKYGAGVTKGVPSLSLLRATERPDPQADLGAHDFCYCIYPHAGDFLTARVNEKAAAYNAPLVRVGALPQVPDLLREFAPLYLQSVKLGEDGKTVVCRLTETDGARGELRLSRPVRVLDLLEEGENETDVLAYRPFEILTIGFTLD